MDWLFRVGLDDTQFTRGVSRVESVTSEKFNRVGRTIEARTEGYRKFVGAIGSTVGVATQAIGMIALIGGALGGVVALLRSVSQETSKSVELFRELGGVAAELGDTRASRLSQIGLRDAGEVSEAAMLREAQSRLQQAEKAYADAVARTKEIIGRQDSIEEGSRQLGFRGFSNAAIERSIVGERRAAAQALQDTARAVEQERRIVEETTRFIERQAELRRQAVQDIINAEQTEREIVSLQERGLGEYAQYMIVLRDRAAQTRELIRLEEQLRMEGRAEEAQQINDLIREREAITVRMAEAAMTEARAAKERAEHERQIQAGLDAASDAVTAARLGGGDVEAAQARLEYEREIARIQLDQTITEERRVALMAQQQGLLEQRIRLLELARREQAEDLAMQIRMDYLRATGREDEARAEQIREQAARRRRQIEQASGLTAAQRLALLAQVGATEAAQLAGLGGAGQAQGQSRTLAGGASLNATQLRQALGSGTAGQQSPQGRIVSNTQRTADGVGRMVALMAQSVQLLRGGLAGVYA